MARLFGQTRFDQRRELADLRGEITLLRDRIEALSQPLRGNSAIRSTEADEEEVEPEEPTPEELAVLRIRMQFNATELATLRARLADLEERESALASRLGGEPAAPARSPVKQAAPDSSVAPARDAPLAGTMISLPGTALRQMIRQRTMIRAPRVAARLAADELVSIPPPRAEEALSHTPIAHSHDASPAPQPVVISRGDPEPVIPADAIMPSIEQATLAASDEAASDEAASDEAVLDQAAPDLAAPDLAAPDEPTSEVATLEAVAPEAVAPEVAVPAEAALDQATPDEARYDEAVAEAAVAEAAVSDELTPETAALDEVVLDEVVLDEVAAEAAAPEAAAPEAAALAEPVVTAHVTAAAPEGAEPDPWELMLDRLERQLGIEGKSPERSWQELPESVPVAAWRMTAGSATSSATPGVKRTHGTLADRVARVAPATAPSIAPMLSPERTVRAFASKLVVPLRSRHAQGRPDLQPLPAEGQADMLRALGDFLDEHDATYFAIATDHDVLKVSWQTPQLETEYRAYRPDQLDALRRRAREQRQHQGSKAPGANAELLRIIGQDLDRESVRLFGITRNVDGYRVSGLSGRTYVTKCYQTRELVTQSVARHRARGGASGMEPGRLEAAG